ncbi:SDR family oxidoreductase [Candidatus Woesearchaeota archaeon]|nr:SDR family oxidoreductase [Candidatus Woesearchaeota archaeon]
MSGLHNIGLSLGLEEKAESLRTDYETNQVPIKNFYDMRIGATQLLIDYFLFEQSKAPLTIDITQFFLLGEPFSKGYSLAQEVISPVIEQTIGLKKIESKKENPVYKELFEKYAHTLLRNSLFQLTPLISRLDELSTKKALTLLRENFMKAPADTPLYHKKKVVVTGSDTGIGREVALEFGRRGAEVILHYPGDEFERGALSAVQLIKSAGRSASCYKADFRSIDEISQFAKKAFSDGIDILVNNAGITLCKELGKTTDKELAELISVNLMANYILTREAARAMKEKDEKARGIIINMSSNHAIAGKAGHSAYAMTKGGILSMTRALAVELAPYNIRVNAVLPGGVVTENHLRMMPLFASSGVGTPLQRWNNPSDVAKGICWYCSGEAKNITGQSLIMDSGMSSSITGGYEATLIPEEPFGKRYIKE